MSTGEATALNSFWGRGMSFDPDTVPVIPTASPSGFLCRQAWEGVEGYDNVMAAWDRFREGDPAVTCYMEPSGGAGLEGRKHCDEVLTYWGYSSRHGEDLGYFDVSPKMYPWSDEYLMLLLLEDGFPYCRVSSNDEDLETAAPDISSAISYYVEAGYEYFNPICPWLAHMGFCVGIDTPEDGDYVDLFGDHLLGAHLLNDDFLLGDPSQDLQLTNPESDCYEACKAIQP